jgi:hypothetical protein
MPALLFMLSANALFALAIRREQRRIALPTPKPKRPEQSGRFALYRLTKRSLTIAGSLTSYEHMQGRFLLALFFMRRANALLAIAIRREQASNRLDSVAKSPASDAV